MASTSSWLRSRFLLASAIAITPITAASCSPEDELLGAPTVAPINSLIQSFTGLEQTKFASP